MMSGSQSQEPQETITGDGPHSSTETSSARKPDHPFGFYSRSHKDSVWEAAAHQPGHIGKRLAEKWSAWNESDTPRASPVEPDQEHGK
ncbi:hypothetical protein AQJ66_36175 [Streptomyces bungoensis]|uniref:Uncharacterized protein n=1 Tax=Streptomyces bungoensis TaxID=285568 RepID=A0A101SK48_9ACTN|nr:hypothetical protein AQJ66_36175 [Streptomyces bungoensis]